MIEPLSPNLDPNLSSLNGLSAGVIHYMRDQVRVRVGARVKVGVIGG